MSGKNINFHNKKIKKKVVFTKSKKHFAYNDSDIIRPLCIRLPQMIGFVKCFESNKTMSFKINDNKLLKTQNQI